MTIVYGISVAGIVKRKKFIIGFWVLFVLLFIVSHKFLAGIIVGYQQRPADETKEAYELITQYRLPVIAFYEQYKRCPQMADKRVIIPNVTAYHYVKTIRFLEDPISSTCFITAVMRDDTPSESVKGRLITIAYDKNKQPATWSCFTNINNKYTVSPCLDKPLPQRFLQIIEQYEQLIQNQ